MTQFFQKFILETKNKTKFSLFFSSINFLKEYGTVGYFFDFHSRDKIKYFR